MTDPLLERLTPDQAAARARRASLDAVRAESAALVARVRREGDAALRELGRRFDDLGPLGKLVYPAEALAAALARLPDDQVGLLRRVAGRIERFAAAQRDCVADLSTEIDGGRAGWRFRPVRRAGCYAPGGRFPLPSSVLMTAVTARIAGVSEVIVASPRPDDVVLAAAAVAGADRVIAAGGAQAVAALALGTDLVPRCDVVVGPGNLYVTAAKQVLGGEVRFDMLAGPSELLVLADADADPDLIAADLIAQAEHDPEAVPLLVTTDPRLPDRVDAALRARLADLPTSVTARTALYNGGSVVVPDLDAALALSDRLAPEHLELLVADASAVAPRLERYGALFVGPQSAEVFGDYGAGPNHVLPTGGTARFSGGLSVLDFLVGRTWLELNGDAGAVARDARDLARLEGLEGHARAAEARLGGTD